LTFIWCYNNIVLSNRWLPWSCSPGAGYQPWNYVINYVIIANRDLNLRDNNLRWSVKIGGG